jgi:hypothetical protein
MTLNCTINSYPLVKRNFWRKDGHPISNGIKHEIKNLKLNEYAILSQLVIKVSFVIFYFVENWFFPD